MTRHFCPFQGGPHTLRDDDVKNSTTSDRKNLEITFSLPTVGWHVPEMRRL